MNLQGMKNVLILLSSLLAVFWNTENFFDFREGKNSKRHFYAKCEGISKVLFKIADNQGQHANSQGQNTYTEVHLPDLVGFAEVENEFVVKQLLRSTLLRKTDYKYIHYDSPDHRGIDCALLYRSSKLTLIDSKPCHITDSCGNIMATRDILLASFTDGQDRRIDVLVNHHPSKFGGKETTDRRGAALKRMESIKDSLAQKGGLFISFGDFNEEPGYSIPGLKDISTTLKEKGLGTIRFNGNWELIDRCYVPENTKATMTIFNDPSLNTKDSAHGGEKPRRTNSGPRYLGGLSDHYPIVINIDY